MNAANPKTIVELLAKQELFAQLVDTTAGKPAGVPSTLSDIKGLSGIEQKLQGVRSEGALLLADRMVFPAVKTTVGAVVVYTREKKVLVYSSELDRAPRTPRGGDVVMDFSKGILQL